MTPRDGSIVTLGARWRWLKQVAGDRGLTPSALHVALALADKVNPEKGFAWPRISVLADITGLKERGIRGLTDELVARGHLTRKVSRGPGASNEYRLLLQDADDGGPSDPSDADQNRHDDAGIIGSEAAENRHGHAGIWDPEVSENRHGGAGENRHGDDRNTGMAVPPNIRRNNPNRTAQHPAPAAAEPYARSTAAAAPMSNEEMLRRLRNAASLRIEEGPGTHNVQPIRDLMAEGADFERHVIPAVLDFVPGLPTPLRTWKAGPLVKAIRARMASVPVPSNVSATSTNIRGALVPDYRILRRVREYIETGTWPDDVRDRWGPAPDEFGTCIPKALFIWTPVEGPMPEIDFRGNMIPEGNLHMMIHRWRHSGDWIAGWGYPPDDPRTSVPDRFRQPPRTPSSPLHPSSEIAP